MRTLIKLFLVLMLLGALAGAGLAWFALSDSPLVSQGVALSHEDIARARTILQHNDPRNLPPGAQRSIEISAQDLNLAANYLLQKTVRGKARLNLGDGLLLAQATLHLPRLPARNYVNLDAAIQTRGGIPEFARLQIGGLNVPGPLATMIVRKVLLRTYGRTQVDSATELVRNVQMLPDRLRLDYQWNPALLDQARDTLLTGQDQKALRAYHDRLVALQAQGTGSNGSLTDLLKPLFVTALERSRDNDPVEENTALLTVLGTWASRQDIAKLVPGSPSRPRAFRLKLEGRTDFGQHFLTSAALAARGDSALSDAVGLFKEISDTDRGSGFSFTDIAADRAGTRFGELATRSEQDARQLQRRLAGGVAETDIMPPARDLPEHMNTAAFRQRFGHVGSPPYQQMMAEIERRIDACSLYAD